MHEFSCDDAMILSFYFYDGCGTYQLKSFLKLFYIFFYWFNL